MILHSNLNFCGGRNRTYVVDEDRWIKVDHPEQSTDLDRVRARASIHTCRRDAHARAVVAQQLRDVDHQPLARAVAMELGAAGEHAHQRAGGHPAAGAPRQEQLVQAH